MSWVVTGYLGSSGDQLYFGVWDDSTSTGNIYQLTRNRSTATTVPGGSVWTSSSSTTAFTGRISSEARSCRARRSGPTWARHYRPG